MPESRQTNTTQSSVEHQPSDTALATATMRALAAHDEREEVRGPDYLAEIFLTDDRKSILEDSAKRQWVLKNKITPGAYEFMIARTAFFDAVVQQALRENVPQIVFLGAGYDTRPYRFRDLLQDTRIFELDAHPTQQRKQKLLKQASIPVPMQVAFVPVNFNIDNLKALLLRAGFKTDQRALFVWEGVTYYLSAGIVDDTLSFVSSNSPPGSSICFDYAALSPEAIHDEGTKRLRERIMSECPGEPIRFGIHRGILVSFLSERGYTIIEHLSANEMERKYLVFRDGSSAGKVPPLFCLLHASVAA